MWLVMKKKHDGEVFVINIIVIDISLIRGDGGGCDADGDDS